MTDFTVPLRGYTETVVMRRPLTILIFAWITGIPLAASDAHYAGPSLEATYEGPILIHDSQYRYTGPDRLSFSTTDLLSETHPELLPLRPAIDSWASRLGIHPRVLSAMVSGYFADTFVRGDRMDRDAVAQIAGALDAVYSHQRPHALAASRAAEAVADALGFELLIPTALATPRQLSFEPESAPPLFGYFQPPWEIGDTWSGGGAHGSSHNSLDFWGDWVPWGGDTTPYWVSAMQEGVARVWSSCSVSVIHPNGWVTGYYHLDHVQIADFAVVQRNDRLANYADNEAQAICDGGWSSGPHVHMSMKYDGNPVSVDESNVDFTAFSHHAGQGDYDTNCSRSWYNHFTAGTVCPNWDALLNNAAAPGPLFVDDFESGNTSSWSATVQ